jgi:hypothetical protein
MEMEIKVEEVEGWNLRYGSKLRASKSTVLNQPCLSVPDCT